MSFRVVVMRDGHEGFLAEATPLTPLNEPPFTVTIYELRVSDDRLYTLTNLWSLREGDVQNDGSGLERMKERLETAGEFTIPGAFSEDEIKSSGFTPR